jgi:hypothetical protein
VEHHPSKTSDFLLLLFLEVCESVWILYELNLVDEQHIDEHENYSFFDQSRFYNKMKIKTIQN